MSYFHEPVWCLTCLPPVAANCGQTPGSPGSNLKEACPDILGDFRQGLALRQLRKVSLVLIEGSDSLGGGRQHPGRPNWAQSSFLGQTGLPGHAGPKDREQGPDPRVAGFSGDSVYDSVFP